MRSWCPIGALFGLAWIPYSSGQIGSASGSQEAARQQPILRVEAGKLTAKFQRSPLEHVSEQLAASTRVTFILAEGLAGNLISADLDGVAVEEGLRALLAGYDSFFFYDSSKRVPAALKTVWIYPKGAAAGIRPVGPADWAVVKELETSLADTDPRVRESVYDALLERPDRHSRSLVLEALTGAREQDVPLRERLLSKAIQKGVPIPSQTLVDLALRDPSEQIRWIALDALSEHATARQVAEAASTDPSEAVRGRAKEILSQVIEEKGVRVTGEKNDAVRP
jgi:hypothetical protein